jgi:hypothetical protein
MQMSTLLGRCVPLVWFWDYSSLNSLRALPYLQEWHRRYRDTGLRVIGVHSPQFDFGRQLSLVEDAVRRLGIEFAVVHDPEFEIWRLYGNEVWPALYLWDRRSVLRHYHFAEGGYDETERTIQQLLREIDDELELADPMEPLRETDRPGALVQAPTPHRYLADTNGGRAVAAGDQLAVRYRAASAAAVLDGNGEVDLELDRKPLRTIRLEGPRLYRLFDSRDSEEHELTLHFRDKARAYAFNFAAGPA